MYVGIFMNKKVISNGQNFEKVWEKEKSDVPYRYRYLKIKNKYLSIVKEHQQ